MKIIYQNRPKYILLLQRILLKNYRNKDFLKTENIVKNFLIKKLAEITKLSYNNVYNAYVYYLWEVNKVNFFKNLTSLHITKLGNRANSDALLFVNNCVNALDMLSRFKSTISLKKANNTTEEQNNDKELEEALLLYYLIDKVNKDYLEKANKKLEKINNKVGDKLQNLNEVKKNTIYKQIANQFKNDRWTSSFLPNSRITHKQASGQKRDKNGYFNVGGELLRFPSDFLNGSIGNCVNCKCYLRSS